MDFKWRPLKQFGVAFDGSISLWSDSNASDKENRCLTFPLSIALEKSQTACGVIWLPLYPATVIPALSHPPRAKSSWGSFSDSFLMPFHCDRDFNEATSNCSKITVITHKRQVVIFIFSRIQNCESSYLGGLNSRKEREMALRDLSPGTRWHFTLAIICIVIGC